MAMGKTSDFCVNKIVLGECCWKNTVCLLFSIKKYSDGVIGRKLKKG